VTISGEYFDSNNKFLEEAITIKYFYTETNRENVDELYRNTVYSNNGKFSDRGFIPPKSGIYLVVAETGTDARFQIRSVDFESTTSFKIMLITIA